MEILGVILQFLPVIIILFVANLAQKLRAQEQPYMPLAVLAYLLLALLFGFLALLGASFLLVPFAIQMQPELQSQINTIIPVQSWAWLGWGMTIPSLAGLTLLLKPVRGWIARFSTLDAANPLHAVSLAMTMFIPIYLALTLGIGLDTLSDPACQTGRGDRSAARDACLLVDAGCDLSFFIALIGVGWLTRRSFSEALARLGIAKPTVRQVLDRDRRRAGNGAGCLADRRHRAGDRHRRRRRRRRAHRATDRADHTKPAGHPLDWAGGRHRRRSESSAAPCSRASG
jgi:hypothetical protein